LNILDIFRDTGRFLIIFRSQFLAKKDKIYILSSPFNLSLRIPLKSATHSGRKRPPNPEQSGRAFRRKAATFYCEATLRLITDS
jgi:hypothetical protein